ncbi:hypothetical protein GLAREA_03690 [Glarea lozoyensis ATCC 20868]|uniref:Uncharacterized protein n=1 Tax=Glarea lozoyensis (strain ATCC 20868 / MF5171) TaxID=1116229 RepID=S3DWG7_GLAL2|nr:uncharacterized protein GLAREA_03690 [Glarea lozoyensis ATCC 20868]EPE30723.1 hypothetical protein GLAREA_03690 [Glarea lozoyensis ATCC 20868]
MLPSETGLHISPVFSPKLSRSIVDDGGVSAASGEEQIQAASFARKISSRALYNTPATPQCTIGCNSMIECSLCGCGRVSLASCSESPLLELGPGRYSGLTLYPRPLFTPVTPNSARVNIHRQPRTQSQLPGIQGNITDPTDLEEDTRVSILGLREGITRRLEETVVPQNSARQSLKMRMLLEDVEELIQVTDAALKEVEVALADAKAAPKLWRPTTPPIDISQGEGSSQRVLPAAAQSSLAIPEVAAQKPLKATQTLRRSTALSSKHHSKKSIEKKQKKESSVLKNLQRSRARSSERRLSKWTLTEFTTSIADAFKLKGLGKKYRGIEGEKTLTPERIKEIRQAAVSKDTARNSADSTRSNSSARSDTPTDPFHLEELASRLDANLERRTSESRQQKLYSDIQSLIDELEVVRGPDEATPTEDHELLLPLTTEAPLLPAHLRTNIHKESNSMNMVLPTIGELSPFNFSTTRFPYGTPSQSPTVATGSGAASKFINKKTPLPQNDQKNTYLPSTLYTRLSPQFLQGPIQISNSSIKARRLEKSYSPLHTMWEQEEPVDWNAFQMATLGNSLPANESKSEEDEDTKEDLCEWWEALAVGPPGKLVKGQDKDKPEAKSSASSGILEVDEIARGDMDKDAKQRAEAYFRELQELSSTMAKSASPLRGQSRQRKPRPFDLGHHNRRELDSTSTTAINSPETPGSLPPSPMFDLAAAGETSKSGKVEEARVPMGFNLGHDLGDYLNWEARHVPAEDNPLMDDIYDS